MKSIYCFVKFIPRLLIIISPILLSGCGDSRDDVESTFSGSVGDGPIVGATVNIYNKNHKLIRTVTSGDNATYFTRIKGRRRNFPLTLEVEDGTDLVTGMAPDFKMVSVILNHKVSHTNSNPFSTMIVAAVRAASGSLSEESVSTARATVMSEMNFGLDPRIVADPIGTQITDSNVAVMTKSSEALGEMIRRVRDHMNSNSNDAVIDGNDVVAALADDISDGIIDGVGGNLANPRISAVSKLVSAQVLVEALSNNLKVQGEVATSRLDIAIMETHPSVNLEQLTDNVTINKEMLEQTRGALYAAQVLAPSIELSILSDILDSIPADSLPSDIEAVLSGDSGDVMESVINSAVFATDDELERVNHADITQQPVNNAPQLSGNPPGSVLEGSDYLFAPDASDADGDILTFSISNKPLWANFDNANGSLSGTPGATDAGVYSDIVISVSDGTATDSIGPFSITVVSVNQAPAISGSAPGSANEGVLYSFLPTASDPDGDSLLFSVSGQPSWATFNTSTGQLSGIPGTGDAGTYSNIVISVSDGSVTTTLPAFSIQVNAVEAQSGIGSFTLSWTAPVNREDGTPLPLSDIASYGIYYGTSPGDYPNSIDVAYSAETHTVTNLPAGTYYVVMTTRDSDGRESTYSQEITTDVQ